MPRETYLLEYIDSLFEIISFSKLYKYKLVLLVIFSTFEHLKLYAVCLVRP